MHARRLPVTLTLIALLLVTLIGGAFSVAAASAANSQPSAGAATAPAPQAAAVTPGNVYAWGLNTDGQLGDGGDETALQVCVWLGGGSVRACVRACVRWGWG